MDILSVDCNNISFDNVHFEENGSKIIICVTYMAWHNRFKQHEVLEKEIRKELTLKPWHPTR